MSPMLLSWFLFFEDDYIRIELIFYSYGSSPPTFITLSSRIARAKTAEKLKGLLSNHYRYFCEIILLLYVPFPSIRP